MQFLILLVIVLLVKTCFWGVFFHSCWDIIGSDVCKVFQQFFKQSWVLPRMNNNVVSLIAKIQGANSIKDYRPIVVPNFKFKIVSKIVMIGLQLWMLESFLLISMGLCKVVKFGIVLVLLLKLFTCFLKRLGEVMWLTKLIFIKLLTLLVGSFYC